MEARAGAGPRRAGGGLSTAGPKYSGRAAQGSAAPWARFSAWLECVCVVTFDLELGQALEVSGRGRDAALLSRPLRCLPIPAHSYSTWYRLPAWPRALVGAPFHPVMEGVTPSITPCNEPGLLPRPSSSHLSPPQRDTGLQERSPDRQERVPDSVYPESSPVISPLPLPAPKQSHASS